MVDNERIKSIREGLSRGFGRIANEPLPDRIEDLLRRLRAREREQATSNR